MNMKVVAVTTALTIASLSVFAQEQDSAAAGKALFVRWCEGCHMPTSELNPTIPGTSVLERRYAGAVPAALEERTDLSHELIETVIRNGIGFMPFFRKTELSDADIASLSEYLAND